MAISKKMQDALNGQINFEFESAYLYLSMSASLAAQNLLGAAHWMRIQAQEEAQHAMKLYDYVASREGEITLKGVPDPPTRWDSALAAFEAAFAHEQKMTGRLNALTELSFEERDHATHNLLQWYVNEQVEEEANVSTIIQRLKLVGKDGAGLYMIDTELGKRTLAPVAPLQ